MRKDIIYNTLNEVGIQMTLVAMIKLRLNETYNKVCTRKDLPDAFPVQNGLRQEDALPQMTLG
jgi:hypothetical protein